LYVVGGRTAAMAANVDANEVHDPIKDSWTKIPSMPSKRGGLTSAAINETIHVFGGEELRGNFNNNEKYDPKINTWTSAQPMPTARHGLAAAVDDKIYVIGGGPEPGGSQTNLNEIFHSAE
jgi:N-acetylneuraminic acid mutarotase